MTKPRARFCWICGHKLWKDHHVEKPLPKLTGDDIPRILHVSCYKWNKDAALDWEEEKE